MALLVDDPLWPAHGMTWAHLVSDTSLEELHEFARNQGLPPRSFDLDHYDVPASALDRLVAAGAKHVDRRTLVTRLARSGLRVRRVRREDERHARRAEELATRWARLGSALARRSATEDEDAAPTDGSSTAAGTDAAWRDLGSDLLERWQEPHRRYHDLRHLEAVLLDLDELAADGAEITVAVELAAWFHDAVHEGRTPDDERASAELARAALASPAIDPTGSGDLADEVARLVLTTAEHDGTDRDAALLGDADLAILASSPVRYERYARDVRAEYAHVPDEAFASGRSAVLTALTGRGTIFATPEGRARWEERARHNVAAELDRLGRRPGT
ncbi:DUF4031 domain-containing protein [Georgenia sp. Z1491]|uniref:DUF4031 domain-containing protein n=1 Tax=Georgenia sp. Z1491 TaxID=3416707 RepID=UPI003CFAD08E